MLQQTTVPTVARKFSSFIERFPEVKSLALASEKEVINEWMGLGYYRRARNLKKAAEFFYYHNQGIIFENFDDLIKCPGIGEYTARAIRAIGCDKKELAVDANIERVISRFYQIKAKNIRELKQQIQELFKKGKILPDFNTYSARSINEALMDLGRVCCKANHFICKKCPLQKNCLANIKGNQRDYPVKSSKVKKQFDLQLLRILVFKNNKVLAYKKNKNEWLVDQLEIPTFILRSDDKNVEQYPYMTRVSTKGLKKFKTSITKYKITNYVLSADSLCREDLNRYKFYELDFQKNNFSTATIKALKIEKRCKPDPV